MSSTTQAMVASRYFGAASAALALGLVGMAMGPRLYAEAMFGPICSGHGSALALHCPACYVAAGLAVAAAWLIAAPRKSLRI